ncbi:hypothetical protein DSECCO2_314130 [anaerobic digester metagenome]
MKQLFFIIAFLLGITGIKAQTNPFEELGYTPRFATLSNGQFNEFHDNDTIVQIGSILLNTKSKQIVGFVEYDTLYSEATLQPDIVSRWISPDPLAEKFPSWSPYNFVMNNPINLIDPDGREPIKPQAGTAMGFVNTINTTGTKLGLKTGTAAHTAMLALGKTEWTLNNPRPMPANTGRINTFKDKYIYTEKGGWIDMAHFMFYAGKAYQYKTDGKENPIGEAVQDGYWQEMSDRAFAPHSAYSYEDLPSDKFGAEFGANYFDPNSKLTFGEQLQNYLNDLGATDPKNAPNYNSLPEVEPDDKPSRTNHTTKPVYTKDNP